MLDACNVYALALEDENTALRKSLDSANQRIKDQDAELSERSACPWYCWMAIGAAAGMAGAAALK